MAQFTPRTAGEWASVLPTYFGMAGLIACFAVWALTNRVEPLFVTTFGGLLAIGAGAKALDTLRQPPAPPIPPGDPPADADAQL
jgi:hypothetical protein